MSRTTKSVAAVGAGILLLTAAGGSFAQWSEAETVDAGTLNSGYLDMTVGAGEWIDTKDGTAINPAGFRMVPGDVLEYRASVTPDLVGDNLEAQLKSDLSTGSGALKPYVKTTATLDGAQSQMLTPANSGTSYDAVVRVEMPYGAGTVTDPNGGEDLTLDLSALEISLVPTPNP